MRIGDLCRAIELESTARVGIAPDEEVHADGRVGIGARLDVLGANGKSRCREQARNEPPQGLRQTRPINSRPCPHPFSRTGWPKNDWFHLLLTGSATNESDFLKLFFRG